MNHTSEARTEQEKDAEASPAPLGHTYIRRNAHTNPAPAVMTSTKQQNCPTKHHGSKQKTPTKRPSSFWSEWNDGDGTFRAVFALFWNVLTWSTTVNRWQMFLREYLSERAELVGTIFFLLWRNKLYDNPTHKEIAQPKWKFCHHLFTLICVTLFLQCNTKGNVS